MLTKKQEDALAAALERDRQARVVAKNQIPKEKKDVSNNSPKARQ